MTLVGQMDIQTVVRWAVYSVALMVTTMVANLVELFCGSEEVQKIGNKISYKLNRIHKYLHEMRFKYRLSNHD